MKSTIRCKCGEQIDITDQLDADLRLIADDLAAKLDSLRDAVAYLRGHVRTPTPDRPAWCWPSVWNEFERRVSGE